MSEAYPDDLFFTKDHEWARCEEQSGRTTATIGISRFAVAQLGDVTQVELPREGDSVKQGKIFGSVESVKAVSDLFAPLSGRIIQVNSVLRDSPELVNLNPYVEGWMVRVEVADRGELKDLMDAAGYRIFLREHADDAPDDC